MSSRFSVFLKNSCAQIQTQCPNHGNLSVFTVHEGSVLPNATQQCVAMVLYIYNYDRLAIHINWMLEIMSKHDTIFWTIHFLINTECHALYWSDIQSQLCVLPLSLSWTWWIIPSIGADIFPLYYFYSFFQHEFKIKRWMFDWYFYSHSKSDLFFLENVLSEYKEKWNPSMLHHSHRWMISLSCLLRVQSIHDANYYYILKLLRSLKEKWRPESFEFAMGNIYWGRFELLQTLAETVKPFWSCFNYENSIDRNWIRHAQVHLQYYSSKYFRMNIPLEELGNNFFLKKHNDNLWPDYCFEHAIERWTSFLPSILLKKSVYYIQ